METFWLNGPFWFLFRFLCVFSRKLMFQTISLNSAITQNKILFLFRWEVGQHFTQYSTVIRQSSI